MAITKISVEAFISLGRQLPVLDVRSPGEYQHAHIPGAKSLPIFSDEERKVIGTAYKRESREKAIKLGLDFFGVKMRGMVEAVEKMMPAIGDQNKTVLVHCWRGGMRSSAVAWLLSLYGFNIYLLEGGYKAYRNWVLPQFEKEYDLVVIGGFTGSGKTALINTLADKNFPVINFEQMANHKGSAFGGIGQGPQPSQEMFENLFANKLEEIGTNKFWLEDESQRIGSINIPHGFWKTMREKPVYFMDIPFEERLQYIIAEYGSLDKELLGNSIVRIAKRLGPLETKTAIGFLIEGNIRGCFSILLNYYDKQYLKGLHKREGLSSLLNKIACSSVDTIVNSQKLVSCLQVKS